MRKFQVFSIIYLFVISCSWGQSTLSETVNLIRKSASLKHANIGVSVFDASNGKKIDGYNEEYSLVPASSLKLLPSLIALDEIGADFKYQTLIAVDNEWTSDGTLNGNFYIVGSGDPTLGSERIKGNLSFDQLLEDIYTRIKAQGISCIDGKIVVDESIFDAYPIAPSWQWNDLGNYYAGGAWGLNIAENEYDIYFKSNFKVGRMTRLLYTDPKIPDLILQNEVRVGKPKSGDNAYVFGGPYDFKKRIVGTIPQSQKAFKIRGAIPDPPKFFARKLEEYLREKGINSDGYYVKIKRKSPYRHTKVLDSISSPSLKTIVKYTNFFSINQYCESLLKTLGYFHKKEGSGGAGITSIINYLKEMRISTASLHMEDGSGLSARNMVSPRLMSEFLAKYCMKYGGDIVQSVLPRAGSSGTVRTLLKGKHAASNIWVKSGSMNRILTYTGLCKARSGKWVTFSVMINGYNGKYINARQQAERILDKIYKMH